MAPPVGSARPSSRRARVVLPEPLSPTTAIIEGSSASIARDSPARARVPSRPSPPAKRLLTSTASISGTISRTASQSVESRHDLFAQQVQGGHHAIVRDEPAAIQLGQNAVDAELVLQRAQTIGHHLRRADQDL